MSEQAVAIAALVMHARLVAHDPGVVPRRHDGEVAGAVFHLLAVVHDDFHRAGDEVASVGGLAAVGLNTGGFHKSSCFVARRPSESSGSPPHAER